MSKTVELWKKTILNSSASIQEAILNLSEGGMRIVLIVNDNNQLAGTVTDGDIRRGLLKGLSLASPIEEIIIKNPFVVTPDFSRDLVVELMTANNIQQIPIVDKKNKIIGLHLWNEITSKISRPNTMLIMAGGEGKRLSPYTEECPKPLLTVAGKPMLEHIINRGKNEGFNNFIISINYLGHMIQDYFGDGKKFRVKVKYIQEKIPLGTCGALSLLDPIPKEPLLVINGDIVTDISYGDLIDFHLRHNASATMAVRSHEWQHPFGVVQTDGVNIVGFEEKPVAISHINAGIYVIQPDALASLKNNKHCDMPTLFERLSAQDKITVAYPMHEPWLDVGQPKDLSTANENNK